MTIKAIETQYKGYRFRSRLEARWAVFFDAVGLAWIYEPEGFDLGANGWYLPDFYFPEWGQWVEVKPSLPSSEEFGKMFSLSSMQPEVRENTRKEHMILCGTPGKPELTAGLDGLTVNGGYVALTMAGSILDGRPLVCFSCFAMVDGGAQLDVWPMYFSTPKEGFMPIPSTIKPHDVYGNDPDLQSLTMFHGFIRRMYVGSGVKYYSAKLLMAYNAARSARFEHGETPA